MSQNIYEIYENFSIKEKLHLFDETIYSEVLRHENKSTYKFIKNIIVDNDENLYIRIKALEQLSNLIEMNILKPRNIISILIDDWSTSNETFLELSRIKYLAQFYDEEPEEIWQILQDYKSCDNLELKSDSLYYLGLIGVSESLSTMLDSKILVNLSEAKENFRQSLIIDRNRIDSKICTTICIILESCITNNTVLLDATFMSFTKLMFERELFSFSNSSINDLEIGIYRTLFNLKKMIKSSVESWIDYKKEISKLSYYLQQIRDKGHRTTQLSDKIREQVELYIVQKSVEPFVYKSFSTQKAKLDVLMYEYDKSTSEFELLEYIKGIIAKFEVDNNESKKFGLEVIQQLMPDIEYEDAITLLSGINNEYDLKRILSTLNNATLNDNNLLNMIIFACIRLQRNKKYYKAHEDDRNTYIADLIEAKGYNTKDQPFWGESYEGKSSGEVDIIVLDNRRFPISIIEALNLNSLRKEYLNKHIDKIYKYNTTGLSSNYILVYSNAKNFIGFWKRYVNYANEYKYKYKLQSFVVDDSLNYSEIRICIGTHIRNGKETKLVHIVVNLNH